MRRLTTCKGTGPGIVTSKEKAAGPAMPGLGGNVGLWPASSSRPESCFTLCPTARTPPSPLSEAISTPQRQRMLSLSFSPCMRRAAAKPVRACILRKLCPVSHVTFEAPLRTSHFSLHFSHSTLDTSHSTLHTSHFALHSSHSTLHFTLHS